MTTVTIEVNKDGTRRSVTVLASRLLAWEFASIVLTVAVGVALGKYVF